MCRFDSGSGITVLICDEKADIVAAMVDVHTVLNPLLAESLAIREGMRLVMRLGFQGVMVESNSLEALNLIGEKSPWQGEATNWIEDIRVLSGISGNHVLSRFQGI